jgi:pyruvate dehydrogenase E2 component (dihydrolipoamide acetyltransferase)
MKREFLMPKLGLTMTEGVVAEWSLPAGARFTKGQTVYVVETDKTANDVASEDDGVLLDIVHAAGDTVPVGEVIAYWDDGVEGDADIAIGLQDGQGKSVENFSVSDFSIVRPVQGERLIATPLARRVAEREGVNLADVSGSGPRGRIKVGDLKSLRPPTPQVTSLETNPMSWESPSGGVWVKPSAIQLAMARRLVSVKQEVPHFYLALEVDVGHLSALRQKLKQSGQSSFTVTHYLLAAVGRALQDEPEINRIWLEDGLYQFDHSDVGMAIDTERGLFAPIVRNAGKLSLSEIAHQTQELIERANAGKLSGPEISGGAITVSNAGMFNVTYMTPIINPGQAMILGVGSVRKTFRPNDQGLPKLSIELGLVLACDHRVLDGASGIRFLNRVRVYLEQPETLML